VIGGRKRFVADSEADLRVALRRFVYDRLDAFLELGPMHATCSHFNCKPCRDLIPSHHGKDHDVAESKRLR
jgi:hypothetical protein